MLRCSFFSRGEGATERRLSLLFCLLAVLCVVTREERCVTTQKMALNKTWIHGLFKSYEYQTALLCRETCSVFDGLVVELKSQMTTDESRAWVSAL